MAAESASQLNSSWMPNSSFSSPFALLETGECGERDSVYQFYEYFERLLLGLVALPIIVVGLCANLTSVRIFTHRLMASSSINWYLAVLSFSDTLILTAAFFVLTLPRLGEYLTFWAANYLSYTIAPYMYGLMTMAQTISVWMTVGVSAHRYIGVCHPYRSAQLLPKRRVTTFITGIIICSVLFNTTRFFEVHVSSICYRVNIDYFMPSLDTTSLRLNETYRTIFNGWAYTIFMYVVPFSLLIVLNWMVLSAVRRSRRMHTGLTCAENDELTKKAERKERQTSVMLVAIVVLFISCNTLAFVVNILENLGIDGELFQTLVTCNNMLVVINASSNICIYMLFSEKYRMLLRHYLCCDWSRQGEMLLNSVVG